MVYRADVGRADAVEVGQVDRQEIGEIDEVEHSRQQGDAFCPEFMNLRSRAEQRFSDLNAARDAGRLLPLFWIAQKDDRPVLRLLRRFYPGQNLVVVLFREDVSE